MDLKVDVFHAYRETTPDLGNPLSLGKCVAFFAQIVRHLIPRLRRHLDSAPNIKHSGTLEKQRCTLAAGHPRGQRIFRFQVR